MKPTKTNHDQGDLFRSRLSNQLNPKHELYVLANKIAWETIEAEYSDLFRDDVKGGCPPKSVRLVVGMFLLQYLHNLSDEAVVRTWIENPYWQYFCGYDYLQWQLPMDPSSLSRWRGRLGKDKLEKILSLTVKAGVDTGVITPQDCENVIVDTTGMPKNIVFPTDAKLYNKSRERMVKLAKKHKIKLRQNYNLKAKKLSRTISGYLHAKQMRRAKAAIKKMKNYMGRVMRDIERQIVNDQSLQTIFKDELGKAARLSIQTKSSKNKLYSLHEPDVQCISKGKAHKRYEFGCKASFVITHKKGKGFVLAAESLHGMPYDGHTLNSALLLTERITGVKTKTSFVDAGYRGHDVRDLGQEVWLSRQKRGVTNKIRKAIKRRQAIEPHFGHMKMEGRLGRCRLWGVHGDQANVILVAAGYNLRLILNHLRKLLRPIYWMLISMLCMTHA